MRDDRLVRVFIARSRAFPCYSRSLNVRALGIESPI
jgi:hypothetical protein